MALTGQKLRFVEEYLKTCINGEYNATQAAINAGYSAASARTTGYRLLRQAVVKDEIDRILHRQQDRILISKDRVLDELRRIATVDISQAFDEQGNLKPLHEIPEDVRRAMAGVDVDELWDYDEDGKKKQVGWTKKVRFWDKNRALELLGKHFKMYTDKVEMDVRSNLADRLKKARERVNGGNQ